MSERVVAPLLGGLTGVASRFTPAGFGEGIAGKLVLAGSPPNLNVDKILVMKLLGIVSVLVWVPLVFALKFQGILADRGHRVLWGASFLYPDVLLNRKIADRQKEISAEAARHASTCSSSRWKPVSGSSRRSTARAPRCPVRCRTSSVACSTRSASVPSRADALRAMADRTYGARAADLHPRHAPGRHVRCVDLEAAPRSQADEMRIRRRLRGAGAGAEGAGEDAVPLGVLHLPVDLRRDPRPGIHPDPTSRCRRARSTGA